MFAHVVYLTDGRSSVIPISYVRQFHPKSETDFQSRRVYRAFWSGELHQLQSGNSSEKLQKLKLMTGPPSRGKRKRTKGDGYYDANILCLAENLEDLIQSMNLKRPYIPKETACDEKITEDDDSPSICQKTAISMLQEKDVDKRTGISPLIIEVKSLRTESMHESQTSEKLRRSKCSDDTQGSPADDPGPTFGEGDKGKCMTCELLRKEKEDIRQAMQKLEQECSELRELNINLQTKFWDLFEQKKQESLGSAYRIPKKKNRPSLDSADRIPVKENPPSLGSADRIPVKENRPSLASADRIPVKENQPPLDSANRIPVKENRPSLGSADRIPAKEKRPSLSSADRTSVEENREQSEDVDLGDGVTMPRKKFNAVFAATGISKFTKSLSVAIWGEETLANRSVTGTKCRNKYGCRNRNEQEKLADALAETEADEAFQRLTPEKLDIISRKMRVYMEERNYEYGEMERNIKKRNKFIAEKIQDIRAAKFRKAAKKLTM